MIDHRTSLYSGSKSHRGVLTDQSAQNRQQRRLESASHCTGSVIIKPKFHQTDTMAKGTNRKAAGAARAKIQGKSDGKASGKTSTSTKSKGKKRRNEATSDEEGAGRTESQVKPNKTEPSIVNSLDQNAQLKLLLMQLEAEKKKTKEAEAVIQDLSSSSKRRKKGRKRLKVQAFPVNDKAKEEVSEAVVEFLYRGCKFLATPDQLVSACEDLMADMPRFKDYLQDLDKKEDYIDAFYEAYGDVVCKTLNVTRSNCQQGLKKAYEERYRKGLPMPTPAQLAHVLLRKDLEYDPEDPEKNAQNRDWFMWHWEALLPKACGDPRWGRSIRNYGIISAHAPANNPKTKYVTSSDEALVLLMYENCGRRFPYCAECKVNNVPVDKNSEQYQSKWTDSAVGQSKFGGWDLAGRVRFQAIRAKISHAKRKETTKGVEEFVLGLIQAKNGIGTRASANKSSAEKEFQLKAGLLEHFNVEPDDDTVDTDGGFTSDLEELDDVYRKPHKKKTQLAQEDGGDSDEDEDKQDENQDEVADETGENGGAAGGNGGGNGESG